MPKLPTPATIVIFNIFSNVRHAYCDRCFREAMRQCPLASDEKTKKATKKEVCEECP